MYGNTKRPWEHAALNEDLWLPIKWCCLAYVSPCLPRYMYTCLYIALLAKLNKTGNRVIKSYEPFAIAYSNDSNTIHNLNSGFSVFVPDLQCNDHLAGA